MRQLNEALRDLSAQLETERDPERLCSLLTEAWAHIEPQLLACQALPDGVAAGCCRARTTLAALRQYRRLVALIDGLPGESEVDELVSKFVEVTEALGDLPVRESMNHEFAQRARRARRDNSPTPPLPVPAALG